MRNAFDCFYAQKSTVHPYRSSAPNTIVSRLRTSEQYRRHSRRMNSTACRKRRPSAFPASSLPPSELKPLPGHDRFQLTDIRTVSRAFAMHEFHSPPQASVIGFPGFHCPPSGLKLLPEHDQFQCTDIRAVSRAFATHEFHSPPQASVIGFPGFHCPPSGLKLLPEHDRFQRTDIRAVSRAFATHEFHGPPQASAICFPGFRLSTIRIKASPRTQSTPMHGHPGSIAGIRDA